jgi:hypothetical protein
MFSPGWILALYRKGLTTMTTTTGWMRNYGAMGDAKLMRCVREFEQGYGDAVARVEQRGGSIDDNRAKCEYEARKKGLIDSTTIIADVHAKTEPKFCPECERKKPFYLDDYICVGCRDSM